MNAREQRGVIIAALCKLTAKDGQWIVPSQTTDEKRYVVNVGQCSCTCPDHQETGFKCKHLYAVEFTMKRETATDGTVTETKSFTFTEKKVYKRNWANYTEAQRTEKHRVCTLLHDLCQGISQPATRTGKGRPKTLIADMVFAATYKVYCMVSARRFGSDLDDAHANGYTSQPIHPNSVSAYLESEELTPVLEDLIVRSSLPLRSIETSFAVDSSGMSTSRWVRWYDHKYNCERTGHDWVKVHIATGVKTNCVTAAAIYGRDAADCPILPELVNQTAENFKVNEVSGDKAYLSVENVETIFGVGGTPFIAFKSNSTGGAGGLFEKMFHFYQFNREEYMNRYHKRSNVESTFSAIKRKFGDSIRSRTDVAMRNEVYAKLICQNLTCVIQSQIELGIEPIFWPSASNERVEAGRTILRFPSVV
jgi:transposase